MKTTARILALLLACGALAAPAWAGSDPIEFGGWLGASLGGRYLDVGPLNDWLDQCGIDPLSPVWPTVGIQARGLIFRHLMLGISGGVSGRTSTGEGVDLEWTNGFAEFDVGWAVVNGRGGLAYPWVGIGGSSLTMKFTGDVWRLGFGPQPLTADQLAAGATQRKLDDEATIYRAVNYAAVGFSYYYPVRFAESSFGAFGMFLPGVTVGANFEMLGAGWKGGDKLYRNGPDMPLHCVFAQIEIAFGGGTTWTDKPGAQPAPAPAAAAPTAPTPPPPPPPTQPTPPAAPTPEQPAPTPEPPRGL